MASFLKIFDYSTPGPGVPKDAPPKPRIQVFFEVYIRKFWSLIKLNMLFFVFNIPALIIMPFISYFFIQNSTMHVILQGNSLFETLAYFAFGAFFICVPMITVGPVQAGFTYVLRNYSREEHAFLWSDFKEHSLNNMKQSTVVCIIDIVMLIIFSLDFNFYFHLGQKNIMVTFITFLSLLIFLTYVIMHLYIYPMMVTFKLTIKQIYMNALIFAIIKFFPNIGIVAICFVLSVIPILLSPVIGIILFFFLTMSTVGYITNFYVYPFLKEHMIDKIKSQTE